MNTRLTSVLLPLLLATPLLAQYPMGPAPQVKKLESMVGNWAGEGTMVEPNGVKTGWKGHGTYQWTLNGHWLREDFRFDFDGGDTPILFRSYIGWDATNERYVVVQGVNDGRVLMHEVTMLGDGTMLLYNRHDMPGAPMVERARTKFAGDEMTMSVDFLMPEGPMANVIDAKFTRTDKVYAAQFDLGGFMGAKPADELKKMAALNGVYETKGQMVMDPKAPAMKITGTDTFEDIWDGTIIHGRTDGVAEGSPMKYESHAFYGYDPKAKCVRSVFVDNMGMVGQMEGWFMNDTFVSIQAGLNMGQPMTQRFVMWFADGAWTKVKGTTCAGAMEPFVSFDAAYSKKK